MRDPVCHSFLQEKVSPAKCDWYDGPTLIEMLDNLKVGGRNPDASLRIPVLDKYTDRGVVSSGGL
jgi:peptide chain release factor subunit 3